MAETSKRAASCFTLKSDPIPQYYMYSNISVSIDTACQVYTVLYSLR